MRDLIYDRDFISKKMEYIIRNKIRFLCTLKGKRSPIDSIRYVDENKKGILSYLTTSSYDTSFTKTSPRAAQYVHAYLTGKPCYLHHIDKELTSGPSTDLKVFCIDSLQNKIQKILKIQ